MVAVAQVFVISRDKGFIEAALDDLFYLFIAILELFAVRKVLLPGIAASLVTPTKAMI